MMGARYFVRLPSSASLDEAAARDVRAEAPPRYHRSFGPIVVGSVELTEAEARRWRNAPASESRDAT